MAYRPDRGWGFAEGGKPELSGLAQLESRIAALERGQIK
jgi:hypothetical protein